MFKKIGDVGKNRMASSRDKEYNKPNAREIFTTNNLVQKKLENGTLNQGLVKMPRNADLPPELPPLAKPFGQLSFPFKDEEDKKDPTSAHRTNRALIGPPNGKNWTHFFKHYDRSYFYEPAATIAEAEAAIGALYKFLAPDNVPTTRLYFDENTLEFVGVTSKAIPNFKSNFEDPLQEKDTIVQFNADNIIETEIAKKSDYLSQAIQSLITVIGDRNKGQASYIPGLSYIKGVCNYRLNTGKTSIKFKEILVNFQKTNHDVQFTEEKLKTLIKDFEERKAYVSEYLNDEVHKFELDLIKISIDVAKLLYTLISRKTVPLSAIPYLEMLDKKAITEKINLDQNPNRIISLIYKGKPISIIAKYLKNYRRVKRLTQSLVARYLMQDTDGHINNMDKEGNIYDFDMAKLRFLFNFRKNKPLDNWLRQPDDLMFVITSRDIANFFDITDANYYYWVTKPTTNMESYVKKGVSYVYTIAANYFMPEHTEVFLNLSKTPIVSYHSLKGFLKYALWNGEICRNYLKLHMRPYATFIDKKDGLEKSLMEEMVKDEEERISQVRDILINLPQFQDLMEEHDEFIFASIKEELVARKQKVEKKIEKIIKFEENIPVQPFKELADSINIEDIELKFRKMMAETKMAKTAAQRIIPVPVISPKTTPRFYS